MAAESRPVARVEDAPEGAGYSPASSRGSMRPEEQFDPRVKARRTSCASLLDRGIATLDTANTYGRPAPYTVEEFVGKAVKESGRDSSRSSPRRGSCGSAAHTPEGNRIRHYDFTAKNIKFWMDRSLQSLGTDHVDVYFSCIARTISLDPTMRRRAPSTSSSRRARRTTSACPTSRRRGSDLLALASGLKAPTLVTNQIEFSPLLSDSDFQRALPSTRHPPWLPADDLVAGRRRQAAHRRRARARRKIRELLTRAVRGRPALDGPP